MIDMPLIHWLIFWLIASGLLILIQFRMIKNQTRELRRMYSQERVSSFYNQLSSEDRHILRTYMEIHNKQGVT